MTDNIRPSLYGAKYSAIIANKLDEKSSLTYRIGGKLCESGDILIEKVKLAKVERDDLLLVPFAGSYTYSMSSNYNKLLKPAVVFVEDGKDYCAVKRQSLEDLIKRVNNFMEEKSSFDGNILCISHGIAIRSSLFTVLKDLGNFKNFWIDNGSLTVFDLSDDKKMIECVNLI